MLNLRHHLLAALALGTLAPAFLPLTVTAAPKAVRGVITSIDGDNFTLKQPWGEEITVVIDGKRRRCGRGPFEVGTDVAIILFPDVTPLTAQRLCTRIVPAPPYVAVQPIKVPMTSAPPAPVSRPIPAPAPAPVTAPPATILY
ncbi:hypothetical protein [Synechococcus sp. PCC 6312]|uniref:hypothetical protein n=1 Tax=Synechococcus sp. (strain ATCC 27167 / PCC 6312) TaxID=195253 RepID=UPI00029F21D6|nr:hypothetical protein [Synechococcus sp. PCC 6312]AFY60401.1 hypothetical protein Syn6312_1216 [Synechococcus sp. PCC 6312]